jgi:hypothetical protein
MKRYIVAILIGIDQLFNAIFGGDPDETISSRWGRTKDNSKIADAGCEVLDVIDPNHCSDSIEPNRHFDETKTS